MVAAGQRVCAVAFAVLAFLAAVSTQHVTRVIDGDTIVVNGVGAVRLIGVDTPEATDPRVAVRQFSAEAAGFTRKLAEGKRVRLEFEGRGKDRYNRTLAYVYLPDGSLLNAEIIRQGYGHAYTAYPFGKMEEFRRLEREAVQAERGMWAAAAVPAAAAAAARVQAPAGTETVYVTRTGTKYHRSTCRSLARSQIAMSLNEAAARYGACSMCRPPTPADVLLTTPPAASAPLSVQAPAIDGGAATSVMISRTGTKYHRAGCRTLRGGGIPTTLAEASSRFEPCAVCSPPRVSPSSASATRPAAGYSVPPRTAAASARCQATTKRGTQCSRAPKAGSSYCWQHAR